MARGKLIIVNGPSGSGKGKLIAAAREKFPGLLFSISCTTRGARPGETDGVEYYFLSPEAFQERIDAGDFLEWAEYGTARYGTLKSEVLPRLEEGGVVMLEIELRGVRQVQAQMAPEDLLTIYVDAGSWETLERRITGRAPMPAEELEKRRLRYAEEVTFKDEADVVVQNYDGKFAEADEAFMRAIEPLITQ